MLVEKHPEFEMRQGRTPSNPAKLLILPKLPKTLPKVPTAEQVNNLVDAIDNNDLDRPFPKRDRAIFEYLYGCGLRISELQGLNLDVDKGDFVAFLRSEGYDDQACIARSSDGGKNFQPWQGMGFQGHPLHAFRLADQRVLLTYGYRHAPLGIRARILNAECTDFATAPEIVLRDDGGTTDLGYPWSVQLDATHVLVTYYHNLPGGVQHIAGTILEIP